MRQALLLLLLSLIANAQPGLVSLRVLPADVTLRGAGSSQQLLVVGKRSDDTVIDLTARAQWSISKPGLARIEGEGRVFAVADGGTSITASVDGKSAKALLNVRQAAERRQITFSRDIESVFTKRGCNSAACHGGVKGKGGFKLSVTALHPAEDYEWIVKGGVYQVLTAKSKGEPVPRVDLKNPELSSLLRKPTGEVAHGGGKRLDKASADYQLILDWIRRGAPADPGAQTQSRPERIEVFPALITLGKGGTHRLLVTAYFADGRREDLTHEVLYQSNNPDVAAASADGTITAKGQGETSILIRAAGHVASAGVGVIADPVANYPAVPRNNYIDEQVFAKLRKFNIVPSGLSSDSEFLRRACLDLAGMLPPPARVREFLASKDPRKREKLVDALIGSPEFVDFWTFRVSDYFRVAIFANGIRPKWSQAYWEWIRESIETNKPYDVMARERLGSSGYDAPSRHYLPYDVIGPPPDTMAEEVRVFFGRRLDCAQCHNHPYENWSQDQFWGMAAFFGPLFKLGVTGEEYVLFDHPRNDDFSSADVGGSKDLVMYHPRSKAEVNPAFLDGPAPSIQPRENPRKRLAEWMVSHPYFAEAAANRMWGYFFGRGLVDPIDDFRSTNPPSHPELLALLGKDLRDHRYDLRHLMRQIVLSRTYQLSSRTNSTNAADRTNYSRSAPRPLEAEVLLDAISDVTGIPEIFANGISDPSKATAQAPRGTRAVQLHEPDWFYSRFLDLYGRPNRLAVPERTGKANLGQAMHMLAGSAYTEKLSSQGTRLERLLTSGASDSAVIEELYLAAFTRMPSREEQAELARMIAAQPRRDQALRDLLWAILSSREFAENH
ncbi:MAG: DUF1553 domain-containing protein [Bryobacteraceae bacterium]